MESKKKILILGSLYSHNLGDPIICHCVKYLMQQMLPDYDLVLADVQGRTGWEPQADNSLEKLNLYRRKGQVRQWVSKYTPVDLQLTREKKRLASRQASLKEICTENYEAAVFAGGQMFWDDYALFLQECVQVLSAQQIPIYFNACGNGPTYSPAVRKIINEMLHNPMIKYISMRDGVSDLQKRTGLPIHATADAGIWAAEAYHINDLRSRAVTSNSETENREFQNPKKSGQVNQNSEAGKSVVQNVQTDSTVGLGPVWVQSVSTEKQTQFWKKIIRILDDRKIPWKMFCNGSANDELLIENILTQCAHNDADHKAPLPESPEDLIKEIAGFDRILSFRLHSHIVAASLGVPSVALYWDPKSKEFFRQMKVPERCVTIEQSPEEVVDLLMQITPVNATPLREEARASVEEICKGILNKQ